MSLSFRDLKPGGLYITKWHHIMWIDAIKEYRPIPAGTCALVIEPIDRFGVTETQRYRVLVDGWIGEVVIGQRGYFEPVEEA